MIVYFTVVCLLILPLSRNEGGVDYVLILVAFTCDNTEVVINIANSSLTSTQGKVTEHTTVKWVVSKIYWFLCSFHICGFLKMEGTIKV